MRARTLIPKTPVGFAIAIALAALVALGVSTVLAPWPFGWIPGLLAGIPAGSYAAIVLERPYLRARANAHLDDLQSDPHVAQLGALIIDLTDPELAMAEDRARADLGTRTAAWSRVSQAALDAGQSAWLERAHAAGRELCPRSTVLSEAAGWAMGAVAVRNAADESDVILLVAPFARLH